MSDYRRRLIDARDTIGVSRDQMAALLLTPRQTYDQWERGARRTPGVAVRAGELMALKPERWRAAILVADGATSQEAVNATGVAWGTIRKTCIVAGIEWNERGGRRKT